MTGNRLDTPGRRRLRWTAAALLATVVPAGCGDDAESPATSAVPAGPERIEVAAAGDIGLEAPAERNLAAMGELRPDLVLGLGDLSYGGPDSEQEFCDLVDSTVGEDIPFEILAGNHEEDTGGDGQIAEFAQCLPDRMDAVGDYGVQYYFDVGRLARFIMISPDLTIEGDHHYYGPDDAGGETPDMTWLRQAIDGARAQDTRWIVVGMHKNCISVGEYYCDVYQDLFNALIEERVDLVLSAHDHSYQRSKQVYAPREGCAEVAVDEFNRDCVVDDDDAYARGAGTAFIVTAAGGKELYAVDSRDPEAGYFAAAMGVNTEGHRPGFAALTITPERLGVRFVGSTPGSFQDRFEIDAAPEGG